MKPLLAGLVMAASAASGVVHPETWSEGFENGNPDTWYWTDHYVLKTDGGNPGGWLDSGAGYLAQYPFFSVATAAGSSLQQILAGGQLHFIAFDFANLPPGECFPHDTESGRQFTLRLLDFHSGGGSAIVYAQSAPGDFVPDAPSTWQTFRFTIPGDAGQTPEGWQLFGPEGYTWSQMLHNTDAVLVYATDPDVLSVSFCRRLGVDNIVIGYGDRVFTDGFDPPAG
jgi:hypothetical protein